MPWVMSQTHRLSSDSLCLGLGFSWFFALSSRNSSRKQLAPVGPDCVCYFASCQHLDSPLGACFALSRIVGPAASVRKPWYLLDEPLCQWISIGETYFVSWNGFIQFFVACLLIYI